MSDFIPTAWVRTTCPYSFKLRLFLTEAGLTGKVTFVPMDPDAADFRAKKAELDRMAGHHTAFPTVEVAPGEFRSGSDELIAHFAALHGIEEASLPTLAFYRGGLYPAYLEMFAILASPLGWIMRLGRKPRALR